SRGAGVRATSPAPATPPRPVCHLPNQEGESMVGYYADVEFHGELRQDQYPDVCEGASIGYYNEHGKVLRLSNHIDAATYADALQKANTWVEGLRAVTEFVSAGILTGPEKMTVESAASRSRDW